MEVAKTSPHNANWCVWTDPDDQITYEFSYIVGQGGERDRCQWRHFGLKIWHDLPPFAQVPPEVEAFFHGQAEHRDYEDMIRQIRHIVNDEHLYSGEICVAVLEIIDGKKPVSSETDHRKILSVIFGLLDDEEWNGETCSSIADVLTDAGWPIPKDPNTG